MGGRCARWTCSGGALASQERQDGPKSPRPVRAEGKVKMVGAREISEVTSGELAVRKKRQERKVLRIRSVRPLAGTFQVDREKYWV